MSSEAADGFERELLEQVSRSMCGSSARPRTRAMSVFQTEPEVEWSPEFTSVANQLSATAESAYSFDDLQLRLGGVSTASIVVDFEKEAIEGMKAQLTAEFDSVGQVVAG